eukprot:scaffold9278_cov117-Isochrysis_galbana.AAC.8
MGGQPQPGGGEGPRAARTAATGGAQRTRALWTARSAAPSPDSQAGPDRQPSDRPAVTAPTATSGWYWLGAPDPAGHSHPLRTSGRLFRARRSGRALPLPARRARAPSQPCASPAAVSAWSRRPRPVQAWAGRPAGWRTPSRGRAPEPAPVPRLAGLPPLLRSATAPRTYWPPRSGVRCRWRPRWHCPTGASRGTALRWPRRDARPRCRRGRAAPRRGAPPPPAGRGVCPAACWPPAAHPRPGRQCPRHRRVGFDYLALGRLGVPVGLAQGVARPLQRKAELIHPLAHLIEPSPHRADLRHRFVSLSL